MKPSWILWFSLLWEIGSILSEWCFAILCCFIWNTQIYYENFSLFFHPDQLQFSKSYDKKVYCLFHLHHSHKFLYNSFTIISCTNRKTLTVGMVNSSTLFTRNILFSPVNILFIYWSNMFPKLSNTFSNYLILTHLMYNSRNSYINFSLDFVRSNSNAIFLIV